MAKIITNDFLEMREEMKAQYARFKANPGAAARQNVEIAINLSNGLCKSHITEIIRAKYDNAIYRTETVLRAVEPSTANQSLLSEIIPTGNKKAK